MYFTTLGMYTHSVANGAEAVNANQRVGASMGVGVRVGASAMPMTINKFVKYVARAPYSAMTPSHETRVASRTGRWR